MDSVHDLEEALGAAFAQVRTTSRWNTYQSIMD